MWVLKTGLNVDRRVVIVGKMADAQDLFSRVLRAVNESIRIKKMGGAVRETADDLIAEFGDRPRIVASAESLRRVADEYDAIAVEWDRIAESNSIAIADHVRAVMVEREAPAVVRPCGF